MSSTRTIRWIVCQLFCAIWLLVAGVVVGLSTSAEAQEPIGNVKVGLEVGDMAPEIIGEDIDGKRFKLSDYRGKVVMLDFWGDW